MNVNVAIEVRLTQREVEVLLLLSKGMRLKEIPGMLGIAKRTTCFHVSNICAKLSASNVCEAVANGFRAGILE
jgi:DNA-binding NarL/FixJ family response regulator